LKKWPLATSVWHAITGIKRPSILVSLWKLIGKPGNLIEIESQCLLKQAGIPMADVASTAEASDISGPKCGAIEIRRAGLIRGLLVFGAVLIVVGVFIWQAATSHGNPDPLAEGISPAAAVMNTGIVVFREGLEAVLVLAALTASMVRKRQDYWKPIALGAALSFAASIATWFVVVALIDSINAPALHLQAATGILAIVVLLVIMNWFFHKVYWGGWIGLHEKRKRTLLETPQSERSVFWGLMLVGLTAVYREGFEVVLFLQNVRLQSGQSPVLVGAAIGLALTGTVAFLTFVAQRRLPFKRLLVVTGVMLGAVLLVMVGASGQAMQQAGWLSETPIDLRLPEWVGAWLGVYPNVEGLSAQAVAASLVIGSYLLARRRSALVGERNKPSARPVESTHLAAST
jgi:high-affinity iron transporter